MAETTTLAVSTPEQAVSALVTSDDPVVLEAAITEIAKNLDTLTTEQLDQIAQVVSQAPKEVKEKFEEEVNIFGGGLDGYVPVDSNVTVGQRRVLVAIGAVLTAAPVFASRRK